jgi:hypothetical protein
MVTAMEQKWEKRFQEQEARFTTLLNAKQSGTHSTSVDV